MAARVERQKEPSVTPAQLSAAKAYLLVVDDDHAESEMLRERLRESGIMADIVHNAEDSVRAFSVRDFDMIVMNLRTPLQSGLGAAHSIREKERHFPEPRVPIMMFSGGASESERKRAKDLGIDDVVPRPKDAAELQGLVQSKVEYERRTPSSSISREPINYPSLLILCGKDEAKAQEKLEQFVGHVQAALEQIRAAVAASDLETARRCGEQLRQAAVQMASGRIQRTAALLAKLTSPGQLRDRGAELVKELESHVRDLMIWRELKIGQQIVMPRAKAGPIKTHIVKLSNFLKKRSDIFSKAP